MAEGAPGGSAKEWLAGVFDRAAPTYDLVGGGYHEHFGERLVEVAGVRPGHRVLDVACGHGAVLVPAARAAGAGGRVLGGDLSPVMVERARRSLHDAGLAGEAEVMDAESLGVEAGSFDCVLCGFGLFFLPQAEVAVAGFHRALASGGVVAVSTWGEEDPRWAWEDELLAGVDVARHARARAFDQEQELVDLLTGAGFGDLQITREHHDVFVADADEWWTWKWSYSLRGLLEQLPPERTDELRRAAVPHLEALRTDAGCPLRLTALITTATA